MKQKRSKAKYARGRLWVAWFGPRGEKISIEPSPTDNYVETLDMARARVRNDESVGSFAVMRVLFNSLETRHYEVESALEEAQDAE